MEILTENFAKAAKAAVSNDALQRAVKSATGGLLSKRARAVAEVPEWESLRETAQAIKTHTIAHLSEYVSRFSENAQRRSARVFLARDAAAANRYVVELAASHGVKSVVKSKSMVTEEIGLNRALQREGIEVVETDLGEYVIQLAGERPSHIIAPVLHKTQMEVAQLFAEKLGVASGASIESLTRAARESLRRKFLQAQMGISGGNFAIAETGSIVIVENEGNARLATSLPRLHVAIIGMEKLLPRWADVSVFLRLLARSATGQKMTSYVSILTGPKRADEPDGPQQLHIVLLDNGRCAIAADLEVREILNCIRCGACLNTCPVYRQTGGHAYGWAYPGPIGAVFTPLMVGLPRAASLPFASSLCGACESICPVRIPIPRMLLQLRRRLVESEHASVAASLAFKMWGFAMAGPARYRVAGALLRRLYPWVIRWSGRFGLLSGWTMFRELPPLAPEPFRRQWEKREKN
ncbi:MAG: iron-sulfur cluster-binding protein [Acidobacteria bacterium]|nr:iron-sulfur cluster-binding protein [Acidobacteriota bacterium]